MYDPIVDIIKIVVGVAVFTSTIILLKNAKGKVPVGQVSQEPLTGQEKILVWVLCVFNPILAGAILYYGWRKILPEKARMANQISFAALGLAFVLLILFFLLFPNSNSNAPAIILSPTPTAMNSIVPNLDSDNDGMPDLVEKEIGTDPNKADTDGDGFNDLQELKNGYSPFGVGAAGKLLPEYLKIFKDKIKTADPEFYEKEFGVLSVPSQSPSSTPIVSLSPSSSPRVSSPIPSQTPLSFICGTTTVKDIDNNIYNTVKIGSQCWLKENLRVTKNPAGTAINRYCYNNDPKICNTDGGLYDWNTAMNNSIQEGSQGICPIDWHVPKDSEWYILENYLKDPGQTCDSNRIAKWDCDAAGKKLKSEGSSNFNGLLAGQRNNDGLFLIRDMIADLWSSTQIDSSAWNRALFLGSKSTIGRIMSDKTYGFSIRCLKDF